MRSRRVRHQASDANDVESVDPKFSITVRKCIKCFAIDVNVGNRPLGMSMEITADTDKVLCIKQKLVDSDDFDTVRQTSQPWLTFLKTKLVDDEKKVSDYGIGEGDVIEVHTDSWCGRWSFFRLFGVALYHSKFGRLTSGAPGGHAAYSTAAALLFGFSVSSLTAVPGIMADLPQPEALGKPENTTVSNTTDQNATVSNTAIDTPAFSA